MNRSQALPLIAFMALLAAVCASWWLIGPVSWPFYVVAGEVLILGTLDLLQRVSVAALWRVVSPFDLKAREQ